MSYFPLTAEDQAEMLEAIGVEHFGQLLQAIPQFFPAYFVSYNCISPARQRG